MFTRQTYTNRHLASRLPFLKLIEIIDFQWSCLLRNDWVIDFLQDWRFYNLCQTNISKHYWNYWLSVVLFITDWLINWLIDWFPPRLKILLFMSNKHSKHYMKHIYVLNTHEIFRTKIHKTSECLFTSTLYDNIFL